MPDDLNCQCNPLRIKFCPLHKHAPDLYFALEQLLSSIFVYAQVQACCDDEIQIARVALAKARGETT